MGSVIADRRHINCLMLLPCPGDDVRFSLFRCCITSRAAGRPDQPEIFFSVDLIDSSLHGATLAPCHGTPNSDIDLLTELDPTGIADLRYCTRLKPITSAAEPGLTLVGPGLNPAQVSPRALSVRERVGPNLELDHLG